MNYLKLFVSLCITIAATNSGRAALNAYEPFDYTPTGSDLLGNNGGFGFSTPWVAGGFNASIHDNYDIASGSLSFSPLLTQGNSATTSSVGSIAGLTRNLVTPLGAPGTTAYVSFLLAPKGTLGNGVFNGFFGLVLESPDEPEVFLGKPGAGALDKYVIENRGGADQHSSGVTTQVDETALVVVRADFGAVGFNDTFTMYVNPLPGGAEPLTGTVLSANVSSVLGLTLYSTGAYAVDELRVGDTFADVTPTQSVPETGPGLGALFLVIASLFIVRHFIQGQCPVLLSRCDSVRRDR